MTGKKKQDLIPLAMQAKKIAFPVHFFSVSHFCLSVPLLEALTEFNFILFLFFLTWYENKKHFLQVNHPQIHSVAFISCCYGFPPWQDGGNSSLLLWAGGKGWWWAENCHSPFTGMLVWFSAPTQLVPAWTRICFSLPTVFVIQEWLELEGTSKTIQFQAPASLCS